MALDGTTLATLAEIARESYASVEAKAEGLNAGVELLLQADAERWNTLRGEHMKIAGGKEGIFLEPAVEREEIRRRVRKNLGLPFYSEEELSCAPNVMQLIDLDLGAV